jgi:cytidylate kinase
MSSFDAIVEAHVNRWVTSGRLKKQALRELERETESFVVPPPLTISYSFGSGGDQIADEVARTLGYQLFDREIIQAISRNTKVQTDVIESLDQGDRKFVESITSQLFSKRVIDERSYLHNLARVIRTLSILEPAVFIGRGACHILQGTKAFCVRIVAPLEKRLIRTIGKLAVPRAKAVEMIAAQDQRRQRFIRKNFNTDIDNSLAYDITVNTSRIPPAMASQQILLFYRRAMHVSWKEQKGASHGLEV